MTPVWGFVLRIRGCFVVKGAEVGLRFRVYGIFVIRFGHVLGATKD